MTKPLFFRPESLSFAKLAVESSLPADPNTWQHEVLQEALKQAPFIAEYDPFVTMTKVDPERGYGFGHLMLKPKSMLNTQTAGQPADAAMSAGLRSVRIPILIAQSKLKAMDVFIDETAKVWPLTERRLRTALFRPQMFDATAVPPRSQGMVGMLYPPHRDGHGMVGGGLTMDKGASVLQRVLPGADERDVALFEKNLLGDNKLAAAYKANSQTHAALERIATVKCGSAADPAPAPSVVQFVKMGTDSYAMRTASAEAWSPVQSYINRSQLYKVAGDEGMAAVDTSGSVTMALQDGLAETPPDQKEDVAVITTPGVYKVEDKRGRQLTGIVFPNLQDCDGEIMPVALFTNGAATALQGSVAGVRVGDIASIPRAKEARGYGAFVHTLPGGGLQAMVPMHLNAGFSDTPGEEGAMGTTFDGRQIVVKRQPNLARPGEVDGTVLVPLEYRWMPLAQSEAVSLVPTGDEWIDMPPTEDEVSVEGSRDAGFSLEGGPVNKVAREERQNLSPADVQFYLSAMGVPAGNTKTAMVRALQGKTVRVKVARKLSLPGTNHAKLASYTAVLPLRRNLVKEAAALVDPTTIDAVLSLGFVNPQNLTAYIAALPQFDEAQNRMCELLLAVRLGQRDIPEGALERSIKSLEEVVEGLRTLAFAE